MSKKRKKAAIVAGIIGGSSLISSGIWGTVVAIPETEVKVEEGN